MKTKPSRKEIEAALSEAFLKIVSEMNLDKDAATLCRTFRAVLRIGFSVMEAAPDVVTLGQLDQVLRKTLGHKKRMSRVTPPRTLGSSVLKAAKS